MNARAGVTKPELCEADDRLYERVEDHPQALVAQLAERRFRNSSLGDMLYPVGAKTLGRAFKSRLGLLIISLLLFPLLLKTKPRSAS